MAAIKRLRGTRAVLALVASATLGSLFPAVGAAVVGGHGVSVAAAPWTVFIQNAYATQSFFCTGSILDRDQILTAAHCLYSPGGELAAAANLTVEAGVSNTITPPAGEQPQNATVKSFRVDPGYRWSAHDADDDVAILTLSTPLHLGGRNVEAVRLPTSGFRFPSGKRATVAGFGEEQPGNLETGALDGLTLTVDPQERCSQSPPSASLPDGGIVLCAFSPHGSTCTGDSGAGLVTSGAKPTLIGVVSIGSVSCAAGSDTLFAYVAAPQILHFIETAAGTALRPRP